MVLSEKQELLNLNLHNSSCLKTKAYPNSIEHGRARLVLSSTVKTCRFSVKRGQNIPNPNFGHGRKKPIFGGNDRNIM